MVVPPMLAPVLEIGVVLTVPPVGAKITAVADPGFPQPYPVTPTPISGQVMRPTLVGADVVFTSERFPDVAEVVVVAAVPAMALVGAKITAIADPGFPQPYPVTPIPMRGQVVRPALVGAEVEFAIFVLPTVACVFAAGVVETFPLVGAKTTAVAEPVLPQPYPLTATPISGQVEAPAFAGALVLLPTVVLPIAAWVLAAGAAAALPVVGAKTTAVAEPGFPQPYPVTATPTSGQVVAPAPTGAFVVLLTVVLPDEAVVVAAGLVATCPLVGANATAVAEPLFPQP